jgi:hypothetical protein
MTDQIPTPPITESGEWTEVQIEEARAAQQREIEQESREFRLWQENRRHEPRQTRKRD